MEIRSLTERKKMSNLSKEEQYQIIVTHMTGITNMRKFTNHQDFQWMVEVRDKLSSLIEERREDEELRMLELQELEEKRLKAIEYLKELGLSPETLTISVFEQKKAKKKGKSHKAIYPPKYQYEDTRTKKIKTWSGNAKMPKGLKMLLDEGKNLDDFLIQKTENIAQKNA